MYTPSEKSTEDQIQSVTRMTLAAECGRAAREENLMGDFLTQLKLAKSSNKDLNTNISNVLSSGKQAARSRFVDFFGYS